MWEWAEGGITATARDVFRAQLSLPPTWAEIS